MVTCGGSRAFCYSCSDHWVVNGYLVLTGSPGFLGFTWIPMGSCSSEWADFVGGRWCGLGTSSTFLVWPWAGWGVGEVSWGRWVYSVLGIVCRYWFYCYVGTLTLLWSGWLRNRAGALPGPGRLGFTSGMDAASDRMAGRLAEIDCSDWAVAYGRPGIPWILCWTWQYPFLLGDE